MNAFIQGSLILCSYYIVAASIMLGIRWFFAIDDEIFRKALHSVLLFSYIPFVFAFDIWWHPVLLALLMEALIYPILVKAEKLSLFSSFVNERRKGEFKMSLILAFSVL